jgi:hypothetical protein
VTIPFQGTDIILQLIPGIAIDDNTVFSYQDERGQHPFDYKKGIYYMGIVKNQPETFVGISFFQQDVMGVIASAQGNIVLGKVNVFENLSTDYIAYNDQHFYSFPATGCTTLESPFMQIPQQGMPEAYTVKCPKFYIECDHKVYVDFNSSVTDATNFASGLLNLVSALYYNDSVSTGVSQINVWTVSDPYVSATTTYGALGLFATQMSSGFNGN